MAGCGSGSGSATGDQWRVNATLALHQLLTDVSLTETAGTTVPQARRALGSDSDLYALVFAYADLGGCRSMIRNASAPRALEPLLEAPCGRLQRAARTFTRATTRSDPRDLLAAVQQAHGAEPLLVRALTSVRHRAR